MIEQSISKKILKLGGQREKLVRGVSRKGGYIREDTPAEPVKRRLVIKLAKIEDA